MYTENNDCLWMQRRECWDGCTQRGGQETDRGDGTAIKPLSEQTLMNNYVFSMVMREPKRIKPLLEYILDKKIRKIRMIEPEKIMKEKFESKGIRLDLYVEDEDGVVYDVEVQTTDQKNLPRRMRYYQGMLDIAFSRLVRIITRCESPM